MFSKPHIITLILSLTFYFGVSAQKKLPNNADEKKQLINLHDPLFDNDDILHFSLTGNLNTLFNDRNKNISYHPVLLRYKVKDTITSINLAIKTRGNFRRDVKNCKMPPLMLNFPKKNNMKGSVFEDQNKLKLVVPCQGDEYVIREWLVYKLYNLVTEKSFKAKLVRVDFEDSLLKRNAETHYCILLEDENKLADRNKCFVWKRKLRPMKSISAKEFNKMAVFEYMIGNTDWSVPYLQNIVLLTKDSTKAPFPIPYDFDHAGIVDAPYAKPAEELELSSVRERLYRGFCEKDKKIFAESFELFNKLKDDFYKIYTSCSLVSAKYIRSTIKFLDEFYKVINNGKTTDAEFGKPCREDVRIEIKGLKE